MQSVKKKAFAYITHEQHLLVFSHPFEPEAGIQVPAGTVEEGESTASAVMREAHEETGLQDLMLLALLGEDVRDMADFGRNEIQHRSFYHLRYTGSPNTRWRHTELDPSDGGGPIIFEFFWVQLPDAVPPLIADHGRFLPQLLQRLSLGDSGNIEHL
jgi:8-oxo-dGTP diphosphatase